MVSGFLYVCTKSYCVRVEKSNEGDVCYIVTIIEMTQGSDEHAMGNNDYLVMIATYRIWLMISIDDTPYIASPSPENDSAAIF